MCASRFLPCFVVCALGMHECRRCLRKRVCVVLASSVFVFFFFVLRRPIRNVSMQSRMAVDSWSQITICQKG